MRRALCGVSPAPGTRAERGCDAAGTPIPGHKLSQSVWVCVAIITARQGAVLGSKAQGAAKSMGLDSAFQAVDKLSATDAERRQEEEEAAQREAGHKLKDILRMPEALKVWRAGGYRR